MFPYGQPPPTRLELLRARAMVLQRFQVLLARTRFTDTDIGTFNAHAQGVIRRIESSFASGKPILIGSAARGSAIRQSSDLDMMVPLKRAEARWGGHLVSSATMLTRLVQALQIRFWNTELGRDGQAVVIDFRDGKYPVDVVPAIFDRIDNKVPIYLIPDGCGDWIETSPLAHNRYIAKANLASAGKLKNVAKLVKYWRWCRTPELPLSSFHVEMLLAADGVCAGVKSYAKCLSDFFGILSNRACRGLLDPLGISKVIPAAATDAKRERVYAAVQTSAEHAAKALLAELDGKAPEALQQWDIVFNR